MGSVIPFPCSEVARLRARGFDPEALMCREATLEYFGLAFGELDALCRAGAPRYLVGGEEGAEAFFHPEELRLWLAAAVASRGEA